MKNKIIRCRARRDTADQPCQKDRKTARAVFDFPENHSRRRTESDADDKRQNDHSNGGKNRCRRAAFHRTDHRYRRKKHENSDHVVDRRQRDERLCDRAVRMVFVYDR